MPARETADQDQVGLVVVDGDAVVVGQRVVHGVDAAVVGLEIDHAVRLPHPRLAAAAPSSCSIGSMNGANTSSISAPLSASTALSSGSTQELTTIGRDSVAHAGRADAIGGLAGLVEVVDEGNAVGDEAGSR